MDSILWRQWGVVITSSQPSWQEIEEILITKSTQRQLRWIWRHWGVVITSSQPSWQEIEEILAAIVTWSHWLIRVHQAGVLLVLKNQLIRVPHVISRGYEEGREGSFVQNGFHSFECVLSFEFSVTWLPLNEFLSRAQPCTYVSQTWVSPDPLSTQAETPHIWKLVSLPVQLYKGGPGLHSEWMTFPLNRDKRQDSFFNDYKVSRPLGWENEQSTMLSQTVKTGCC